MPRYLNVRSVAKPARRQSQSKFNKKIDIVNITAKLNIVIVNRNNIDHTINVLQDLYIQNDKDYHVTVIDNNSSQANTEKILGEITKQFDKHTLILNNSNKSLNAIWNENGSDKNFDYVCFLNNDVRLTPNFVSDTKGILFANDNIECVIHSTNHIKYYSELSDPVWITHNNIKKIRQGWDFTIRTKNWINIPECLTFYCGDDFIFANLLKGKNNIAICLSSPILHFQGQTKEKALTQTEKDNITKIALKDITNFKKLGYYHSFNMMSKYSNLKPAAGLSLKYIMRAESQPITKSLIMNISSVEHIPGDIIYVRSHNKSSRLNDFRQITKKRVIECTSYLELLALTLKHKVYASFIYIDVENLDETLKILELSKTILMWGSIIYTPKPNNQYYKFIKDNFFKTYESKKRSNVSKDDYLAIKWVDSSLLMKLQTSTNKLVIATVLNTNGSNTYNQRYVENLLSMAKRHIDVPFDFYCLTNVESTKFNNKEIKIVPLINKFKGYWAKIELFRKNIFPKNADVLYFDLDTLIVNDITDIATLKTNFLTMRDFNMLHNISGAIMKFNENDYHYIYDEFLKNVKKLIRLREGDQMAIQLLLKNTQIDWLQDIFPRRMAEFKNHCWAPGKSISVPDNYSIVCFHGNPKMSALSNDPYVLQHWK